MAYVQPNSIVQLFKGINLDNRYLHTIYFANESAQSSWFSGKVFQTYQQVSYVRYAKNQIKLKADATSLLGVTYMRFMNDRANDKWFYAFVNNIEYVNENTSLITYEIDVMQTWFIQVGSVRPCMVLREHVNDDTFGTNLEAEPVGSDVYDCEEISYTSQDGALFDDYSLIVNTSEAPSSRNDVLNNTLVNGTKFYSLDATDSSAVFNEITALIGLINGSWDSGVKPIEVIDMFTFPTMFSSTNGNDNTHLIEVTHPQSLDGYVPKNNKLFGYPFSYLQASTKNGSGSAYRWEYFDTMLSQETTAVFRCYGNPIGGGQIQCYPIKYNGVENNIDASISMNDFPKNPFAYDAYQAWVAAGGKTRLENEESITNIRGAMSILSSSYNAYSQALSGVNQMGYNTLALNGSGTSVMHDVSGISAGANNVVQGATNMVNSIVDFVEAKNKIAYQWKDAQYKPDIVVGTATPNLSVATHSLDFYFFSVHVRNDELKRLDDFLSVFGYAINKVKQPNITGRAYWNFVQTQNCVIAGDMPASSKEAIGRIFDGGITFWHNGDNVGNYQISTSSGTINNPIL